MSPAHESRTYGSRNLLEGSLQRVEDLLRSVYYHSQTPVLVIDDGGVVRVASAGASQLLNASREELTGRSLQELVAPESKTCLTVLLRGIAQVDGQDGNLVFLATDGVCRETECVVRSNVLPSRHLLGFRERSGTDTSGAFPQSAGNSGWTRDCALSLLDRDGGVVGWFGGAERIYGYTSNEMLGTHLAFLYPGEDELARQTSRDELRRVEAQGHRTTECWQIRRGGIRFWASSTVLALRDSSGAIWGFARMVRDFGERHDRDEIVRWERGRAGSIAIETRLMAQISGGSDGAVTANDPFLELIGCTRGELPRWQNLTPPEYIAVEELAYDEALQFGACAPFEKELVRCDGSRIPVVVITAILELSPFRWVSLFQDLREPNHRSRKVESVLLPEPLDGFEEMVGKSETFSKVLRKVELVAPTDATVLLLGETGTGKELVAKALHRLSPRRHLPFVTLNCAAIPSGLLESELFGHERGAFTGALSQKVGRMEMANHGTLFLDEVGDIPLDLQPKILRALQEKTFERLGSARTIPVDVRIVAATNRNLPEMIRDKLFRSDLYYRLNVFPIVTPPLRERVEDIPALVRHFTNKYAEITKRSIENIPSEAMDALVNWHWPGNIRELENLIERSVILSSSGRTLRVPIEELHREGIPGEGSLTLDQVERDHILMTLRQCGGVVTAAAVRLGLQRTTLNAMIRRLGITRKDF
jgi:formate hydrogenlyase transcriptional activator